ncbi:DNA helicase MCM8-like isoform X2 [Atheta coriaria]|uniref:DNA helicase MCM8-like isoform X2 n=1 Tax=Dalotia coriaria TaxID=877792 RepID=UPI0031F35D5D
MSNYKKRKSSNWYKHLPPKVTIANKDVSNYSIAPRFDYIGYDHYFTETDPEKAQPTLQKVQSFESFIYRNTKSFNFTKIIDKEHFKLNLHIVFKDYELMNEWNTLREDLVNNAQVTINIFALAMHQISYTYLAKNDEEISEIRIIHCRLQNYEPILQIKNLRANAYGKLVCVRGTIIKASLIGLKCTQIEFKCAFCTGTQVIQLDDGTYVEPEKCAMKGCKGRSHFEPLWSSKHTLSVSCQSLKLLELVGEETDDNARMPRTLECEVCNDLVGKCTSGDDVILTGILNVKNANESKFSAKGKVQQSVYELFLKVNNVQNERSQENLPAVFNPKDNELIEKIKAEPKLFRFLVQSLCPKIYGHEIVKAGLLLALFGGTKGDSNCRSDSHVLIVGDPGLGKSQMLLACHKIAPRGVYVGGNTSTNSGLTVTMCKESSGEYRLEAGAMVLADQGCCCIDEFDKMSAQQSCLLEVMEQQSISIAKAGVVCSVPTRASVIAAANPVNGHYNKAKTVSENLKMKSPLLSRFDLVFIILDQADEKRDAMLGEHVLAQQSNNSNMSFDTTSYLFDEEKDKGTEDELRCKLMLKRGEKLDLLPPVLFKKYIAHAKKFIHPQLSTEAQNVLKYFYVDLRRKYHRGDATPVTARQLESMVRLTQARAKLELRETATAEDAQDVVEIMRSCILDVFTDDLGMLDFTRTQNGAGMSNHKSAMNLLKQLQKYADSMQKDTFDVKELKKMAASIGLQGESFHNILDSMNIKGYLLKKGYDRYQLVVCD